MKQDQRKTLTIAIPTYNGGDSLYDAVKSCIDANLPKDFLEILVVDNCSSDDSITSLKSKFKDIDFLKIVKNKRNIGRIGNWNRCLKLAEGDFIMFIFSNDLLSEDCNLLDAVNLLRKNKECSLVHMPWVISNYDMTNMSICSQFYERTPMYGCHSAFLHVKKVVESGKLPLVPLQSNIFRSDILNRHNILFNDSMPISADGIFLSELALKSKNIAFFNSASIIWRYDAPGRLHSSGIKMIEHMTQVIESFSIINNKSGNKIDLTKSIGNYGALEYVISALINIKLENNFKHSKDFFFSYLLLAKKNRIIWFHFYMVQIWKFIKFPLKIKTLFAILFEKK
jgi:glycosyltransferase involved in cell wall biosynthesis